MIKRSYIVLIVAFLSITPHSFGQNVTDTTRYYRIETKDGNIFTGTISSQDYEVLFLKTEKFGEIRIPYTEIKSKTQLRQAILVNNKIWLPNPQSGRYFWAPNGYGLEKDQYYYQNIWVLYNQFSFGLSDNFSIGAGMVPLFLFAGAPTPVWIVPKISVPVARDKLNIGTGAFLGTFLSEDSEIFGLLYETTTFGSRNLNISLGFAYGFSGSDWMNRPVVNISAIIRTGPRGYFITENYIIPYVENNDHYIGGWIYERENKSAVVLSVGGRSIIRKLGLDYSIWIPINAGIEEFIAIPFLGITVPFGK